MPQQTPGQVVYIPGQGFVALAPGASAGDLAAGEAVPSIGPSMQGGGGRSVGLTAPLEGEDQGAIARVLAASPQLAGLLATFIPGVRELGVAGAFAVPAATEAVRQLIGGEAMDPLAMAGEGALGVAGHGIGRGIAKVGSTGKNMVRRALFGGRPQATLKEVEGLTDLAIAEKARLVNELPKSPRIPGGDADLIRRAVVAENAGQASRAGALEDLSRLVGSQALRARTGSSVLPQALAGGGMAGVVGTAAGIPAQATAAASPILGAISAHAPTRMAVGSALAAPFGASTEQTVAPAGERLFRALLSWLESQQTPTPMSSHTAGPRRRMRR